MVFTKEEFVRMRSLFDEYKRLLRSLDGTAGKTGARTGDIVVFTKEEFVRMRSLFDEYKRLLRSMAAEL